MDSERKSRDATSEGILGFFATPVGMAALNGVSEQATQTAKIAVYGLMGIVTSWAIRRVLADIIDTAMKAIELKNALEKK
jgi:hypothetical protein